MTNKVYLGGKGVTRCIALGGDAPVSIQTMWKESIVGLDSDKEKRLALLQKISSLGALGCDILRFAVPDKQSASALVSIANECEMPLVADIHFDYRLALECLHGNISAIRINPGNIGSKENIEKVVNACKEKNVPIRIGVNSGSLPKDLESEVLDGKLTRGEALSKAAIREVEIFDELNFHSVVVSMKSSTVDETIIANKAFSKISNIPLHIGVTEAGPLISGVVKSTLAFSSLLKEDIGATVRVSLSDTPESEVIAAREILAECGKRSGGVRLVSCPRCGRLGFDVHSFVKRWEKELFSIKKDITVAVMGCVVNGPGEGKHADIGITGSAEKAIIFKKGKIVRTISSKDADKVFREELDSLIKIKE
ncbi:MAG: flavodoxin-dependent (E)-4-hydroxy-3-methylbut-2-enyl-diphosphate synthase [Treponema sp.]|nr:flavodoxin-dependent (E)-4-hydroxy-3-methylbut-2-enyl-diphosphate synthase [Treponema sp.]